MNCILILLCLLFVHPGFAQDDEEEMLNRLEKQKAAQQANFKRIQQSTQNMHVPPSKLLEELKKSGGKLDMKQLLKPEMIAEMKQFYRSANFHLQTPRQIREMILATAKGHSMEKVFMNFPKLLDIAVAIVQDKDAFPSLIDLLSLHDELQTYFYIVIGLFILGFVLRRYLIPERGRFVKKFLIRFSISLSLAMISLGIFYYMFELQISPTLRAIAKSF